MYFILPARQRTGLIFPAKYPLQNSSLGAPIFSVHDHRTRKAAKDDLFSSSINTTQYGKRIAKYGGAVLWNNLDTKSEVVLHLMCLKAG